MLLKPILQNKTGVMKYCISVLIYMCLCIKPCLAQQKQADRLMKTNYKVLSGQGNDVDISMLFFNKNSPVPITDSLITIEYWDGLKEIYVFRDTVLLAWYNLVAIDSNLFINNYSIVRDIVSFNDFKERWYQIFTVNEPGDLLKITIYNARDTRDLVKLIEPVVFVLQKQSN